MTPQETANKIISKYFIMLRHDKLIEDVNLHTAKKCSLIAVDLRLEGDFIFTNIEYGENSYEYWKEVKNEIEKIDKL